MCFEDRLDIRSPAGPPAAPGVFLGCNPLDPWCDGKEPDRHKPNHH